MKREKFYAIILCLSLTIPLLSTEPTSQTRPMPMQQNASTIQPNSTSTQPQTRNIVYERPQSIQNHPRRPTRALRYIGAALGGVLVYKCGEYLCTKASEPQESSSRPLISTIVMPTLSYINRNTIEPVLRTASVVGSGAATVGLTGWLLQDKVANWWTTKIVEPTIHNLQTQVVDRASTKGHELLESATTKQNEFFTKASEFRSKTIQQGEQYLGKLTNFKDDTIQQGQKLLKNAIGKGKLFTYRLRLETIDKILKLLIEVRKITDVSARIKTIVSWLSLPTNITDIELTDTVKNLLKKINNPTTQKVAQTAKETLWEMVEQTWKLDDIDEDSPDNEELLLSSTTTNQESTTDKNLASSSSETNSPATRAQKTSWWNFLF